MVVVVADIASRRMWHPGKSLTRRSVMAESLSLQGSELGSHRQAMNRKKTIWICIAGLIVLIALFDISFDFEFSPAGEGHQLDAGQEAFYAACYAERDNEIHNEAFGTIDNPDVQKLYILNNRKQAATECRQQFPQQWTVVEEPFRFNLVDLRFRF